jgi:hypothetical protein
MKWLLVLLGIVAILVSVECLAAPGDIVPYSSTSYWNTVVINYPVHQNSASLISTLSSGFTANVGSFTMPVYIVDETTPIKVVKVGSTLSRVVGDTIIFRGDTISVPIPPGAGPATGSDEQAIFWNPTTGDEWGFWQFQTSQDSARSGYLYNTNWDGMPPTEGIFSFGSRGAGVPYLTGLIRPWEIIQGRIDHAIAFAMIGPKSTFVCPATKSDGRGGGMPEGTRIRLRADYNISGLTRTGQIIATALKVYGAILIDGSGSNKIYGEFQGTANWNTTNPAATNYWNTNLISSIPPTSYEVVAETYCNTPLCKNEP